ncbi:metallophosphoesterase [Candidatus Woesearchaeota archaeon]|nr:metallophosphoesterase [Candidatus Woesearchaeota archaeon]
MPLKILAFTDIHASRTALEKIAQKIEKHKPDLLVCCGDISIFENGLEHTLRKINDLGVRCLLIHGNHEDETLTGALCGKLKHLIFLHKKTVEIDGTLFVGHGGGGFAYEDEDFDTWAKTLEPTMKKSGRVVLVTHQPLHHTKTDEIYGGEHVGSKSYRRFVMKMTKSLKLVLSGHIHECFGAVDNVNGVCVSNPGPQGKMYVIH